ncbi:MAG: hypothetical protein ACXVIY_13985 [Mucilaginibacter sp.]
MNGKKLLMLMGLLISMASCKKGNDYPIVGKWQQVKLRTYNQSYSGVISNDTTYQSSSFNISNYAQFNNDGTCVVGLFYPAGPILYNILTTNIPTQTYNYTRAGSKYVMTLPTTLTYPSGFITTDTASLNGNTVLIHGVLDNHQFYSIYDGYYSK